jgi:hypothetical protein
MDKLEFENPLLKYRACFNMRDNEKHEILELHFVTLGCRSYVKRAPHIIK